eukprot:m.159023 g.159023  ORF g.159023 m.159023 type:complete len:441 (+) comp13363_c2_seq1:688-2010(+)
MNPLKRELKELKTQLEALQRTDENNRKTISTQEEEIRNFRSIQEMEVQKLQRGFEEEIAKSTETHNDSVAKLQSKVEEAKAFAESQTKRLQEVVEQLDFAKSQILSMTKNEESKDVQIVRLKDELKQLQEHQQNRDRNDSPSRTEKVALLDADNTRLKRELEHYRLQSSNLAKEISNLSVSLGSSSKECEEWKQKYLKLERNYMEQRDVPKVINPFELYEPTALWTSDSQPTSAASHNKSSDNLKDPRVQTSDIKSSDALSYNIMRVHSPQKTTDTTSRVSTSQQSRDSAMKGEDDQEELHHRPPSRFESRDDALQRNPKPDTTAHPPTEYNRQRPTSSSHMQKPMSTEDAYMRIMRKYKQRSSNAKQHRHAPPPLHHQISSQHQDDQNHQQQHNLLRRPPSARKENTTSSRHSYRPPSAKSTTRKEGLLTTKFASRYLK